MQEGKIGSFELFRRQLMRLAHDPSILWGFLKHKFISTFLWDYFYAQLPEPKAKGFVVSGTQEIVKKVIDGLKDKGVRTEDLTIDVNDYKKYMAEADYGKLTDYYLGGVERPFVFVEKTLEHYLAAKLLGLKKGEVYVDVASMVSPVPEIYERLYGCQTFRQDLTYPKGLHGRKIGGDAANMPVGEGFAEKMALHCSFEHFEQDADIRFIKEVGRVLKKGGKLCILPLYMTDRYSIQVSPLMPFWGVPLEKDAMLYSNKTWRSRHGRFYDVEHFVLRIVKNMKDLHLTVYVVRNEKEVSPHCYIKFIAVFEKV